MAAALSCNLGRVKKTKILWSKNPEAQDYAGASKYLLLLFRTAKVNQLIKAFRRAKTDQLAAKDLLRASRLPLLDKADPHVQSDLKRIDKGKPLAPILLVRGNASAAVPLTIADGYHRICAICYFDENQPIPCRLVD
jgi:hypothetical protein